MITEKSLLDYANLFSRNNHRKNDRIIYKYFKNKYIGLDFRLKKIDEARNYHLEKKKHNNLMSEKHKKVGRALTH